MTAATVLSFADLELLISEVRDGMMGSLPQRNAGILAVGPHRKQRPGL